MAVGLVVTLAALPIKDEHAALVALAQRIATEIDTLADDARVLDRLAGRLVVVLEALGATPASAVSPAGPRLDQFVRSA